MMRFRSDSRVMNRQPLYFYEYDLDELIFNKFDRMKIAELKVGEYYLNELARYTRVQ
ncbi:hypothetical protein PP651_gp09 [Aeromonas phage ZPAH14]|uniref:Uncharacterized protein n=1 Tax=Aeromonas phage ZPAH14 TaxID=2924887 RepID=A0AAE9GW15_9CAUD|nr:hypothetical protein PP651_gp09 [Aeromonas phage ZPAH14]UOT58001.1 hypothetical protein [Aeromonas phage ZPAH14]